MSASHIGYLLLLLAPISLTVTLLAHAAVFVVLAPRKRKPAHAPAITILKPVKGADEGLYQNLASFAAQDYPEYQLLIGVDDPRDPALEIARRVQRDHPAVRIEVLSGARNLGLNRKSMLFRRKDLDAMGGWWPLRSVLAEDYVLGRSFELAGFRVAVSPYVIRTVNDGWTVERFVNRHLRWAQMRRRLSPAAYLGELLLNPVLFIVVAALVAWDLRPFALGALGIAVKCASDALVLRRLGPAPRLLQLLVVPFKDLLIAGVWVVGAVRRTINWRGNKMRIEEGSRLVPMTERCGRGCCWGGAAGCSPVS